MQHLASMKHRQRQGQVLAAQGGPPPLAHCAERNPPPLAHCAERNPPPPAHCADRNFLATGHCADRNGGHCPGVATHVR
jgi:hypothetical protein